ncbi:MAG: hypothetical protein AAGC93_03445 [Cyanobacteria bacterium P01_F01_bin.53]
MSGVLTGSERSVVGGLATSWYVQLAYARALRVDGPLYVLVHGRWFPGRVMKRSRD